MNNLDNYVELAANGDRQAYEELYRQTYYVVYYTCFNLLKNEQDSMDVTQDVYVTVMNQLHTLQDKTKFMPWLNRIAVNKCKDFIKKNRPVTMDAEDMDSKFFEENENFLPEEYAVNQAKRQIVLNIMRTALSEKEYETIFLYYFNGLSIKEIAAFLECPEGTVTYRLSVARGKIKQGVLAYENKNDDKLYSVAAVPFLAGIFAAEINELYGISLAALGMTASTAAVGETAVAAVAGVKKAGAMAVRKKVIAGIISVMLVGGVAVAAMMINKNNDSDRDTTETEAVLPDDDTEEVTEKTTEATTEASTTEATTEAPQVERQSLEPYELVEYTENRDGKDTISGHIKDIVYEQGTNCALIILADDGHLYSYYNDGAGYYISDLGQPSWDITSIDIISSDMERERGEVTIFEGNHYYHVEVEDCKATKIVDSVMLEGKEIREIGIHSTYAGTFYVYCEDGSYYYVATNKNDYTDEIFIDTEHYLMDRTGSYTNIVPEGLEMVDRSDEFALCSDGKLYFHEGEAPIASTAGYTFTKLYNPYTAGYIMTAAVTDSNELLVLEQKKDDADILYTIALPETEILDLWYNRGYVIVKTTEGYFSCEASEDATLIPDETFNSLTEDVVEMYGRYVLLSDGYVYEFPYD